MCMEKIRGVLEQSLTLYTGCPLILMPSKLGKFRDDFAGTQQRVEQVLIPSKSGKFRNLQGEYVS
ncbi:hypothetical protein GZ77_05185 [Endozoicomonas montiporae]|uniref:Uncharacterized protein n=1 Tax=Endozoicomonas montiporae TaxID=1027273 RepID=A0A081NBT2_9GAMM|nr:hypothetical protein GZ77_05185 [Endozoicomonas montiporae]